MANEEFREGLYKDKYGRWQKDRRIGKDRRRRIGKAFPLQHERRGLFRRKVDRELLDKDHRAMIDEALDDFAKDQKGHP
jgi:hypothetical protein